MEWSLPSRLARFVDRAGGQNHLQGIGPFANQEGAEPVLQPCCFDLSVSSSIVSLKQLRDVQNS